MQKTETSWYDQMIRKLQINGKSERTQEAYTSAVRQLKEYYEKDPELISEEELEEYFLYRRNESKWASKTLRLCYYGIRFYYQSVLNVDWNLFLILKAQKEERLPEIPTKEAIGHLYNCCSDTRPMRKNPNLRCSMGDCIRSDEPNGAACGFFDVPYTQSPVASDHVSHLHILLHRLFRRS